MNLRLLFCIGMGVFTTYMGILMIVVQLRHPIKPAAPPPKPNFSARSETVVDAQSGERTIYREITVTTRLAAEGEAFEPKPASEAGR